MSLNKAEYSEGESAKVFGYVMDNSYNGQNDTYVSIYFAGVLKNTTMTNSEGYYEYYIGNLTASGSAYNVTANTSSSNSILTFTVLQTAQLPSYTILASSLAVPYANPELNFTVKKYLGTTLSSDSYSYAVYYENGTTYATGSGTSNVLKSVSLPQNVGLYTIVIDSKKSLTVSVKKFDLKFKITDVAGNYKDTFKPNGIAYFEVEGYSSGQKITNATVTAVVTDPTGTKKTVTFTEATAGLYKGNTNITQTGTPVQLRSGDYEVEFTMKDSSNNQQKAKGFFDVLGLNVEVDLLEHKPYKLSDGTVEFDITVKNLENGNLLSNDEVAYSVELEMDGKIYDVYPAISNSTDATISSEMTLPLTAGMEDGGYHVDVKATSSGKQGYGHEYFELMNTDIYIKLTDNFNDHRDIFKPGELGKITVESDINITFVELEVYDKDDNLQSETNNTFSSTSASLTFNVPTTQADYVIKISIQTADGNTVQRQRWFSVQNYFSWLDVKALDNTFQFAHQQGSEFLAEINVFDIGTGNGVDISSFVLKFDKIVNQVTGTEYTNLQAVKNTTYSDTSTGRVVYNIVPASLANGIYRIEYTLVNTKGDSFEGDGWFGISAFDVDVLTYDTSGQEKKVFAAGATVNVTVVLSSSYNGTATIHREFFDEKSFSITNGRGSTTLKSTLNELPSQSGFYGFGVDVETSDGNTGLGDGFFEVKNLNFRSITVRNNAKYAPGQQIIADVVIEKSGSLVNDTNVTLSRLTRARDGYLVSATSTSNLTSSIGMTTLTITPGSSLEPGEYFAELKAVKDTDATYAGFGFRIVEDKVIITINDQDNLFSSTDNIEVNIKVTYQNDTPKNNVTVNLTGLLNLNTWAPVSTNKQATTSSNGIATVTLSASNFNAGRYAPIAKVAGVTDTVVGFGEGEFEIKPFTTSLVFSEGKEAFQTNENIQLNLTVTGSVTVTATVKNMNNADQGTDYAYSSGVLTLNNDLAPGEYLVEVVITQGTTTVTETLWFEVMAPWMHLEQLPDPNYADTDTINFSYTVFTNGANGFNLADSAANITYIENLWTGAVTWVGQAFDANGSSTETIDLTSLSLDTGDYLMYFDLSENAEYENSLYFRVSNEFTVFVNPEYTPGNDNITIVINTTGLSSPDYILEGYKNYNTFTYTGNGSTIGSGADAAFDITGLENGFYEANIRIEDGSNLYYWNTWFDIRKKDTTILAPSTAGVGVEVQFNISSASSTIFWIIDPFTQTVLNKEELGSGYNERMHTFNYPGFFMYSFGATKWDAFPNAEQIEVVQAGFQVDWPFDSNRFVLTGSNNFTFNVTADSGNSLQLNIKNLFNNVKQTINLGTSTGSEQEFSFDLDLGTGEGGLGLGNGPHDVELILLDQSSQPPKSFFFIDIFPDQYEMWGWTDKWEYSSGETVTINLDIYDITQNWMKESPDNVTKILIRDPFGQDMAGVNIDWTSPNQYATITTTSAFLTGNYHGEIEVNKSTASRIVPFDFFVRGNDNLELFWNQNKWDYASSDTYSLTIDVRDNGVPVSGVAAQLSEFNQRSESWDQEPVSYITNVNGANFTNGNVTDANGRLTFTIDLSETGLPSGGYNGRINVGGQPVWFDFNLRSFQVDAYPEEWEYGITDTIQINVRARNIETWAPLDYSGNVTVKRIQKHEPGFWQPTDVSLSDFGLMDPVFTVDSGEALIEMMGNQTALALDKAYEFELVLEMNLSNGQTSEGWAWFRLSNSSKPAVSIVDSTGSAPDAYFAGQSYTLQVTNVQGATLKNIWGPGSKQYNQVLVDNGGTYETNFTTPFGNGYFTMEIEIQRDGFMEYLYEDFTIGSGVELNAFMSSGNSIIPGVNFTVNIALFGEGDDPFCTADWCDQHTWFGPLANKTVTLKGIRDLETFTYSGLDPVINVQTNEWPSSMIPKDCASMDVDQCNANTDDCAWTGSECDSLLQFCSDFGDNETECSDNSDKGCSFNDQGWCSYMNMGGGGEDMDGPMSQPGDASFNLHPTILGLEAGKKYDLVFSYIDDEAEETEEKVFVYVEQFHVAISKRESNVAAKSTQSVWLKTQFLNATPIVDCNILFSEIYSAKDYQLVKQISINETTDQNGTASFSYIAPSLPGEYLIQGTATCDVDQEIIVQDIAYFIDVGAKGLDVDMKTRFDEDENIKVSITTKDRLGLPDSQKLNLNLFHDKDDYPYPVYSLGGTDCTVLDANQDWMYGGGMDGGMSNNNFLEETTDLDGKAIIELCPLPSGMYMMDIFPMFEFGEDMDGPMMGPKDDDQFGFFADFTISSGTIDAISELKYSIGDTVMINITALDDDNNPINGTIIAMDQILESFDELGSSDLFIYDLGESTVALDENGWAQISYTLNATAPSEENESVLVPIGNGMADIYIVIQDNLGNKYTHQELLFVVSDSDAATISAPATAKTNEQISVHVTSDNAEQYKVQVGAFFLTDNMEKMKDWFIEGGVFLSDVDENVSEADFKILTPREPGSYWLGIPIFRLEINPENIGQASAMLISPIEVTLDLVNVTGTILNKTGQGLSGATVILGKKEATTDAGGQFAMSVPKAKYPIEIYSGNSFMKTDALNFDQNIDINMTFYKFDVAGKLTKTFFNITRSTNLDSETRLNLVVNITNDFDSTFSNMSVEAVALSGKTIKFANATPGQKINVTFNQLYAGFEEATNTLMIKVTADKNTWNSSGYANVSGIPGVNSTIGYTLKKEYTVTTYATAGDRVDNDNDGLIDEEENNNKDDDLDGKIDEDLESALVISGGFCGDGICKLEEDNCYEDCGGVSDICGDGDCTGDENYHCPDDCGGTSCTPNTCDGAYPEGEWCNQWGVQTTEQFCDFCSWFNPGYCGQSCNEFNCWACDVSGSPSSECEGAGCKVGTDDIGNFCYFEEICDSTSCWGCHNTTACSGAGNCQWEYDPYSPDGGWCQLPFNCESDCKACGDQNACDSSLAFMTEGDTNVSCVWFPPDSWNPSGFCDFNFTHGGFDGREIKNLWIDSNSSIEGYMAMADFEGFSGNMGMNLQEGCYYVMVELGSTEVSVSVNGTEVGLFDNSGNTYVQDYASASCYTFSNGTYIITAEDQIGPDYLEWWVTFGENGPGEGLDPEMDILVSSYIDNNAENITFTLQLDDFGSSPLCGGSNLGTGEYEGWKIQINSTEGGCDLGAPTCLDPVDYTLSFEVNETGGWEYFFEYWNGSSFAVNSTAFLFPDPKCSEDELNMTTSLNHIDAEAAQRLRIRYTSYYYDGSESIIDSIDNIDYVVS